MKSYKELIVWQKGIQLVTMMYTVTSSFPKTEQFGLTSQIRRASVSIPANIAEGYTRGHRAEYVQFLRIAFSSGAELETHLLIAKNLAFIKERSLLEAEALLDEIMRMLNKMISTLNPKP